MNVNKIERFNLIQKKVTEKGGFCLESDYKNSRHPMKMRCKNNHDFNSTGNKIMRGIWCLACSGSQKLTIDKINLGVKSKNIICISSNKDYNGNKSLLKWQCLLCNFVFEKSKNFIDKDFNICKKCNKNNKTKIFINEVNQRGGKVLGDFIYSGSNTKIHCICINNHEFKISYNNLINVGHWCNQCAQNNNISEEICRIYMESLFEKKFPKIRPNWLLGENGRNLELDGYCEELNLAFEHQGTFHYEDKFGKDKLENILKNDHLKQILCKKNKTKLIIIPQLFNKTPLNKLKEFIMNQCSEFTFNDTNIIDLKQCYINSKNSNFIIYKKIAYDKGGKCISDTYYGSSNEKLIWECKEGHQWKQYPYVIKKGHWCPVCANQPSKNIIKYEI